MKKVVYSGTFDPITLGHMDIVERALCLFDEVVIGVATGFGKNTLFPLEQRVELAREVFRNVANVQVHAFDGLLVDFVDSVGASAVIRGLRAVSDFEYEFQMAAMNRKLNNNVETLFLTPSERFANLSSTMIRQVAQIDPQRVEELVHPHVMVALKKRMRCQ